MFMAVEPFEFRPAVPSEAGVLGEMTLAGISYWGHQENFPGLVEELSAQLPVEDDIGTSLIVNVLSRGEELIGFYSLKPGQSHVELLQMFLDVDFIGHGYGKALWEHAVREAAKISLKLYIESDPAAVGFYRAMGATLEREVEVMPGFKLGIFTYDLVEA